MNYVINRSRTKTTKWNLFFTYFVILYNIIVGIILVPLYLKFISKDIYGYWLATGNILAWLTMIDPGFGAVMQQKTAYHYGARNLKSVGNYAFGGIIINICFLIIIALVGIIFSFEFPKWLKVVDSNVVQLLSSAYNLALIGTLLMIFSFILVGINQGLQSSLGIGLIYTFANISAIVITIILLYQGWNVVAIGASILCRALITVIGNILYLIWRFKTEKISLSYEKSVFKDFTDLSIYNLLGKIGSTLNTQLNAFISSKFLTPIDTTIFKLTQTAPETSKLIITRPSLAITPSITHLLGEGNYEKIQVVLQRFLFYLIWGSGLAFAGFILFNKPFITLWVGISFYGGNVLNTMIVILLCITIFTQAFSSIVFALGNIKRNNLVLFGQALVFVPLVIIGTRMWGLKGMVLASIIAELSISGWYFPMIFFKMINMSKGTFKIVFFETIKVVVISLLLILIFDGHARTWLALILEILLSAGSYFIVLFFVSKVFKREVNVLVGALKLKLNW